MTSDELKRYYANLLGEYLAEGLRDDVLTLGEDEPNNENGTGLGPDMTFRLLAKVMMLRKPNKLEEMKHAGNN